MKTLFVVMLLGLSFFLQDPQTKKQQLPTISTEPKEVVAELKIGDRTLEEVRGDVVFTPSAGNADDTLTGMLVFKMSETERKRIAGEIKTSLVNVPATVKKDGVIAHFERDAKCPDLNFEFFVRHKNFDVSKAEVSFGEGRLQFRPFVLSFKESDQELSGMLCLWAKRIWGGRGTKGMSPAFTKVLKGEDPYK